MGPERHGRWRAFIRHGAVLLSAGALVAALNIAGVGSPQPAFTSIEESDRSSAASRSQPDRLEVQPGITVGDDADPFVDLATGQAELTDPGDGSVCISSPLPPGVFRISSNYGMRTHPITGSGGLHAGVDLAAPMGTPIHAVASGTVSYAGPGRAGRSSELVIIDHEVDGIEFSSWYVHMYPDGVFVEADQEVRAGEIIAEVGTNGNSTGPHLHLEIHTQPGVVPGKGTSLGRLIFDAATPSPEPTPEDTKTPEPGPTESETSEPEDEETEDPDPSESPSPDPEETEDPDPSESPSPDPEDEDTAEEETPEPEETTPAPDIEIEEDDDEGKNDHTIDDTIERDTGVFDPSSLGVLHDPLPFLRDLGYGLAAPGACLAE